MRNEPSSGPWWKFGYVWLVVAGPVAVVLASVVTVYLAITRPDPLVSTDYYQRGLQINQTSQSPGAASLAPAIQARNHAATGVVPEPDVAVKP